MLYKPTSSPMMTSMLGCFCAAAGFTSQVMNTTRPHTAANICLYDLMPLLLFHTAIDLSCSTMKVIRALYAGGISLAKSRLFMPPGIKSMTGPRASRDLQRGLVVNVSALRQKQG